VGTEGLVCCESLGGAALRGTGQVEFRAELECMLVRIFELDLGRAFGAAEVEGVVDALLFGV